MSNINDLHKYCSESILYNKFCKYIKTNKEILDSIILKRPTIISDIYEILNITCKCPYYENGQFQFAQHLLESKIGTLEINNCTCGNPHNIFENKNVVAMIVLFIAVHTNDNDTKKFVISYIHLNEE